MSHRSPARFLAPLALLAASGTIYVVVKEGLKDAPASRPATGATTAAAKRSTTKRATTAKAGSAASVKRYTVKSGDVLGAIATRTGVSVDDLLSYNRLDAAQPLRVGQKLKLEP